MKVISFGLAHILCQRPPSLHLADRISAVRVACGRSSPCCTAPSALNSPVGITLIAGYATNRPGAASGGSAAAAFSNAASRAVVVSVSPARADVIDLPHARGSLLTVILLASGQACNRADRLIFAEKVKDAGALKGADLLGCNIHGQIARADGQFEGFQNCTAVVAVLPK